MVSPVHFVFLDQHRVNLPEFPLRVKTLGKNPFFRLKLKKTLEKDDRDARLSEVKIEIPSFVKIELVLDERSGPRFER